MRKAEWHLRTYHEGIEYFDQMLLDLYTFINPVLHIVDGVMAMEGMGPGFGPSRHVGLLFAGTDGVAVDRIVAEAVAIPPEKVSTIQMAVKKGYGKGRIEQIEVVGEKLEDVRVSDFKPPAGEDPFMKLPDGAKKFLKNYFTHYLQIIQQKCEVCKLCQKACPMQCISDENERMEIHKKNCIRCYCCMEACPHAAIELQPGGLLKAYQKFRKIL
jgi:Pyruvate/2-oxoacid:ferredoxin oxidoreductase delta subunit